MSNETKTDKTNRCTCHENTGVLCDVVNCVYHDGECHCKADKINVGPSYATSCTDTVCATFKQKTTG